MRYHEFAPITELFKGPSKVPYKLQQQNNKFVADFKVGENNYTASFEEVSDDHKDDGGSWEFAFFMHTGSQGIDKRKFDNTRTGNEFTVYNTVLSILKEFLYKFEPAAVMFEGKHQRAAIYQTMIKHLQKDITQLGYKVAKPTVSVNSTIFVFIRNDLTQDNE